MRQGSVVYYLHTDHLGSSSVSYRADGQQTITQRYYPWGAIRPGPDNALPTDHTFTGQKLDESTGLMYYGARYYDPALGRFVQADTVVPNPANPQALNRYSYVLNNPMKYVDPSGHIPCYGDPARGECSWAGTGHHRIPAATRRRDITVYVHFIARQINKKHTSLDALLSLADFASLFGTDGPTFADDISYALLGATDKDTLLEAFLLKGKEFLTGKSLNLPEFGDTGFHRNYRDFQEQAYHFWGYVNTTAQGGLPGWGIGLVANELHEKWDPTEALKDPDERGTSWEDYFLSFKGMRMGYSLHTGALSPDQASAWMRRELTAPAGRAYTIAKATGTWWWPSVWIQKAVDMFR